MSVKNHIIFIFLFFSCSIVHAQLNATTIGDAQSLGNNCFIITPDILNQQGGVWYDNAIDFDTDFIINYQNNFGNKDGNGADGMALVFKNNPTPVIGGVGGGLGYEGISPSLVVEFDTFQNGVNGDPVFDHIAIMRDAIPVHFNSGANLAGPIEASLSSPNIEDGNTHEIKIEWDATTQVLSVFFDCELRLTLNLDIKNEIFSGDDTVFFGFVGSTGGLSNLHQVCFNSISFVDNLQLNDETTCPNDMVQVDATTPSGITYNWSPTTNVSNPNIADPILTPDVTTTYTVTITDICGDTTTDDITITVNSNDTPTFNAVPAICEGGSLTSLPTTSNNGITGTWSPTLNNTTTTTYTFTPDAGQCSTSTATLEIIVNPNITPTFNAVPAICEGGSLTSLPTISNNGITGTWSPTLNNTTTTTYTFTPDANQCATGTVTLDIIVNPSTTPTFDAIDPICEGETLAALQTTSNNGITGTWSPALDNTTTTTYTFTPDTGQGCVEVTTLEIVVNTAETPIFTDINPICEGNTIAPLPTTSLNGFTGTWSPALNNTVTTTYTFTPDATQCATTATLQIVVTAPIDPTFDTVAPICEGDTISALPTTSNNGISGTWSPVLNNTTTTTYTFTPNIDECANTTTLTIPVIARENPIFDAIDPICEGETLAALPTTSNNGFIGTWSPALNNTTTTTYTFTADANQCATSTVTLEVIVNPNITPTFDVVAPICENDTLADLPTTSNNGFTGVWSPAIDNTTTTIYTFTPDVGQGCVEETTLEIVVNAAETPTFTAINPICEGDTIAPLPTTSNNGFTGTWSPSLNNLSTTTYTFTPNLGECATITTLDIIVNAPVLPVFDTVNPICEGGTLSPLPITSNNGISGSWSPALNNTVTTTYTFTPNPGECGLPTTLDIVVDAPITPLFDILGPFCEAEAIPPLPTTSNNGISGSWSPALNNTATTTYTFTPNAGACANATTLTIDITPNTTPTFDVVNPICPGDFLAELPLTSNNGITGTWSPALDNTITTTYTFTPDVGQSCVVNTTLEIVVTPPVVPTFDLPESFCEGEIISPLPTVSLEGVTGAWSEPINNQITTNYIFTPDPNQCASSIDTTIGVIPFSQLEFTIELTSEAFSSNQTIEVTVTGGNGIYVYQLDNGPWVNNNIFMNITGCNDHIMKVRQIDGCSNIATETFTVLDYPKFFTPNGDGDNPTWNIICLRDRPGTLISIFNRYGKLLKQISPNGPGWDGTFNGNLMPTSDYWFRADYFNDDGNATTFSSHFSLKR